MLFFLLQDKYKEFRDDGMEKIDIMVDEVCKSTGFIEDDQQDKEVAEEAIEWQLDKKLLAEFYDKVVI